MIFFFLPTAVLLHNLNKEKQLVNSIVLMVAQNKMQMVDVGVKKLWRMRKSNLKKAKLVWQQYLPYSIAKSWNDTNQVFPSNFWYLDILSLQRNSVSMYLLQYLQGAKRSEETEMDLAQKQGHTVPSFYLNSNIKRLLIFMR